MKELDKKMAIKNSKYQEEMNQVQDSHELEVAGLLSEHRELTTKLREKLEKLEMMSSENSKAPRALRDEMEELIEFRDVRGHGN